MALAVFGAVVAFAWREFTPGSGANERVAEEPSPGASASTADPWASVPERWTELPLPPEIRDGSTEVWDGREVLSWGGIPPGAEEPAADGFAFDPATSTWRTLPAAPGPGRDGADAVWTGSEVLFIGGTDAGTIDGVAFDPATNSWRSISPSSLVPRWGGATVWTGSEAIVWGGGHPGAPSTAEGAAYDPATDTWRSIAEAPRGLNLASGVWTGSEAIFFGSLLDNGNHADTDTSVGVAYDPANDTWREIAPSTLSPQATAAAWVGGRMLAYDYEVHAAAYDPATDIWSDLPKMPLDFSECYPDAFAVGNTFFAWFCGDLATYDASSGEWNRLHGGMLAETIEVFNGQSTAQLYRFASLVPAGSVIAFAATGITTTKSGEPCYGCEGSPVAFWVWRPSATA